MGYHVELDLPLLARAPDTFDRGPFSRLFEGRVGVQTHAHHDGRRAVVAAVVAWVPLLLLSLAEMAGPPTRGPVGLDIDTARYLVALPLLIVGLRLLTRRLNSIVDVLADGGYIGGAETHRLDRLLESSRALLAHPAAAIAIVALAFGVSLITALAHGPAFGADDVWRSLVSQPLLLACLGNWIWRTAVWTRLVWSLSTYHLRLLPSHPDLAGGLLFVSSSIPAFIPLAIAVGAVAATTLRHAMIVEHRVAGEHLGLMLALAAGVVAVAVGPLLPFSVPMRRARMRGMVEYGALANQVGRCFERRWLHRDALRAEALASPEFSATTDLYAIATNVNRLRALPFGLRAPLLLLAASVLPFAPVALATFPPLRLVHFALSLLR